MSINDVRDWLDGGRTSNNDDDTAAFKELMGVLGTRAGVSPESLLAAALASLSDNGFTFSQARAVVTAYDWVRGTILPLTAEVKARSLNGLTLSVAAYEELRAMAVPQKLQAIKKARELTGAGLKEAKDFIEEMPRGVATTQGAPVARPLAVGDRVRCPGLIAFGKDWSHRLSAANVGRVIEVVSASIARVSWARGEGVWNHLQDELVLESVPEAEGEEPAAIRAARIGGSLPRGAEARLFVKALLSNPAVLDAYLTGYNGDGDDADASDADADGEVVYLRYGVAWAVREARRGRYLTVMEVESALAEYDRLTGRVSPERLAAEEAVSRLEAELAEARTRLHELD